MAELRKHSWPDSTMKVLVIYDGCHIAARAIAILADTTVQWSIRFWQLNSLSLPPAAERALVDTADAQLILLAGRRVRALPALLRFWLEQWATRRQIENAALAVMSDEPNATFSAFAPFELSEFAGQNGLSFITEDGPAVERCSTVAGYDLRECGMRLAYRRTGRQPTALRWHDAARFLSTFGYFCGITLTAVWTTHAQLDPEPRQLLHLGVNQSLHEDGPQAHYLFYYWNMPNVPSTNQVLRLILAPTYLDGQLGFKGLLGENTDLGVGVFGGGYAYDYDEVRRGNYYRDESFEGHGGGANVTVYHRFNPEAKVPLNGLVRATVDYRTFSDGHDTADNFVRPENQPFITLRAGFRYGGQEPVLFPCLAMEISAWYELEHRTDDGGYGFAADRRLEATSHRFFGRAQLNYTLPKSEHFIVVGFMGGAVLNADRFSAFRVGGALPFSSEFPLYLPGYFYGELSAKNFGLAYGLYSIPLGPSKRWNITAMAGTALVDYVNGMEQPGHWNSGVGGGFGYTARDRRWRMLVMSSYGIDAIRSDGRGGYNLGVMLQYNFGKTIFASDRAFEELRGARFQFR